MKRHFLFMLLAALLSQGCGNEGTTHTTDAHDHEAHEEETETTEEFVCPMHPQIRQPHFGTCPICHMDLVPVQTGGEESDIDMLQFSETSLALLDIQTEKVVRQQPSRHHRVYGVVISDPRQQNTISAWAAGRIESLSLPGVGEPIRKGQAIGRLFSPTLSADIAALQTQQSEIPSERLFAEAAAQRLRNAGLSNRQIERYAQQDTPPTRITLYASHSGTVAQRLVRNGDYVTEGQALVELATTEAPWLEISLDQRMWAHVHVGQNVRVEHPEHGAMSTEIAVISPLIDPQTRRFTARALWPLEAGPVPVGLRIPVHLEETHSDRRSVFVPESAVLWAGERAVVWVVDRSSSPPVYQPVDVETGERWGELREIRKGLFHGEEIVREGAFRLDATLYLRSGGGLLRHVEEHAHDHSAAHAEEGGSDHAH